MAEPTPAVTDALKQADAAVAALRKTKPKNVYQGRARAGEQIRIQKEAADLGHRVTEANAEQRITSSNGHANEIICLSDEYLTKLARAFVPYLKEAVAQALMPVFERIVELEARVIELRQAPSPRYRGVWSPETGYHIGDFVTDYGSVWHCERACTGVRPGDGTCWLLAVKHGRNAKDKR
jgi:hypothetical protein